MNRLEFCEAKHFTEVEIKGLTAFYQSPLGQKIVLEMPQVEKESMAAGQQWGQEVAERAVIKLMRQRLKKSGPSK